MDTPMRVALAPRDVNGHVITVAPVEISSTENQRIQARLDMEKEVQMQPPQGPRPVDGNTLAQISKAFFDAYGERASNELLISLLSNYNESLVLKTIPIVKESHDKQRMSVQGLVTSIRMILEGAQGTPVYTASAPVVQDKYKVLPQVQCSVCKAMLPYTTAMHCKVVLNVRSAIACGLLSVSDGEKLMAERGTK
jgi:hypothetical protein